MRLISLLAIILFSCGNKDPAFFSKRDAIETVRLHYLNINRNNKSISYLVEKIKLVLVEAKNNNNGIILAEVTGLVFDSGSSVSSFIASKTFAEKIFLTCKRIDSKWHELTFTSDAKQKN